MSVFIKATKDIEMLQRLCTEAVFNKFLELGHFTDDRLSSKNSGLTLRDWIRLDEHSYYKGRWNRYNEAEGIGVIISQMMNLLIEGGPYIVPYKNIYEGQIKNGKAHGIGRTIYDINGAYVYLGEFIDGMQNGQGIVYQCGGAIFEGNFV